MKASDYLDRLLVHYADTYDIYQPYSIDGREYPAFGYFFSHTEKYVLTRDANLWSADSYEHILFQQEELITPAHVANAKHIITDYMEPSFVRKGEKYPGRNHMYSFLTVVLVSQKAFSKETIKAVKYYHFDKGYRFNMRGYSQGHLVAVSMEDQMVITNSAAKRSGKLFRLVFDDLRQGKKGFLSYCEEQGILLKKQLI